MFKLPDLDYRYDALEPYIDTQTMKIHHTKHHAAYVKNLNDALAGHENLVAMDIEELLRNLDQVPENSRMKVRNNGGGHFNHSVFWKIMGMGAGGKPAGKVLDAIGQTFGDFDAFKEKFTTTALSRFGSGWVWLVVNHGALEIMDTPNQDSPLMGGMAPILGLDLWEHAYYLKYQNRKAEYVDAWWNIVNWTQVEANYNSALG